MSPTFTVAVVSVLLATGMPRTASSAPSRAEALCEQREGVPGGQVTVGLRIVLEDGWHTYWVNPGDSGMAPLIRWSADVPVEVGPAIHPAPRRFEDGGLVTFGHAGEALIASVVTLPDSLAGDSLTLRCEAQWLVCRDTCVPQTARLEVTLPLRHGAPAAGPPAPAAGPFEALRAAQPKPREHVKLDALSRASGSVALRVEDSSGAAWLGAGFFPYDADQVSYDRLDDWRARSWGGWLIMSGLPGGPREGKGLRLRGVLRLHRAEPPQEIWLPVDVPVRAWSGGDATEDASTPPWD